MPFLDIVKGVWSFLAFLPKIGRARKKIEHDFKVFGLSYLHLYSTYIGDATTIAWLNTYGRSILEFFSAGRLGRFRERTLIQLSAKEISKIYKSKSFTPCNSLDMDIFLHDTRGDNAHAVLRMVENIARIFQEDSFPVADLREEIIRYCQYPNGLISWYMYSALPILYRSHGESCRVFSILDDLIYGKNASRISQYVALKALSVLILHTHIADKPLRSLFERGCATYLAAGSWIEYPLDARHGARIAEYAASNVLNFHTHGCALFAEYNARGGPRIAEYFTRRAGDVVTVRYDSGILDLFFRYTLEVGEQNHLPYAVRVFATVPEAGEEYALFVLSKVCNLAAEFPAQVLITIKESLAHPGAGTARPFLLSDKPVNAGGLALASPVSLTRKARAAIEAREWTMYDIFSRSLRERNPEYARLLDQPADAGGELRLEKTDPYHGERIYQHFFMANTDIRKTFGRAIAASASAGNVRSFFKTYSAVFAAHFKRILLPAPPQSCWAGWTSRLKGLLGALS